MTAKKKPENQEPSQPAAVQAKPRSIHYRAVKFKPSFATQLGGGSAGGALNCKTTEQMTSRYSARWVAPLPVIFINWLTHDGDLIEYDIPLTEVESMTRLKSTEELAPLK